MRLEQVSTCGLMKLASTVPPLPSTTPILHIHPKASMSGPPCAWTCSRHSCKIERSRGLIELGLFSVPARCCAVWPMPWDKTARLPAACTRPAASFSSSICCMYTGFLAVHQTAPVPACLMLAALSPPSWTIAFIFLASSAACCSSASRFLLAAAAEDAPAAAELAGVLTL